MHLIAYTSEFLPETGDADSVIKDIISHSKKNNTEAEITGVLFFHEDRFLQIIEGEEDHLRQLMKTLESDSRHKDIKYLIDTTVTERSFGGWHMGDIQLGKNKHFDADYLEEITKRFEQLMVPSCAMLTHFYQTLLAERKRVLGVF